MSKVYKTRLRTVEAIQYTGSNYEECLEFYPDGIHSSAQNAMLISDPKGDFLCLPNWWIIRNEKGEYSTMSNKEFLKNYE